MAFRKILFILAIFLALSIGFSAGTWAFFVDNEASTADQMASGTLDLKTDDADGVSQTLYNTSIDAGESIGPATVVLKNAGSVIGSSLDISFSYLESDDPANIIDMSEDQTAAIMEVTTLSYNSTDLLAIVSDNNSNSYIDIQDITNADLAGQSGLAAGASKDFIIEITTDNSTWWGYYNDGITLTMNFSLNQ